jgi:chorismate synthase
LGISITANTLEAAGIHCNTIDIKQIEKNMMRAPDAEAAEKMVNIIKQSIEVGDSVGGIVECICRNVPVVLGEPVFDKLDALLAHAILSIGAVKGIEFGMGFGAAKMRGSEHNDMYTENGWTNNAGGINGGISSGKPILFRCAVKPTPSISKPQKTMNSNGEQTQIVIEGRHDPCICPRIIPVVEAMTALNLLDAYYLQFGRVQK